MNKLLNESSTDRIVRVVLGIVLLALGWGGVASGGFGVFLKWFALIPLLTGVVGFCPLYALLKLRTNKAG